MNLVATVFANPLVEAAIRIAGLSVLACVVTALVAFVYRVRVRDRFPEGATLILGLGVVAIALNTRLIFIQFVGDIGSPLTAGEAMVNIAVFVAAGIASYGGRHIGDRAGTSERITWGWLQPDFSPIVRAAGRFISVTLPEDIEDIEGYDPVDEGTKSALGGRKLDFPRGLTVTELQSQIISRLKEEHDIGYVDVELTMDGTIEYLAVGQRAAGIGPTLPPKTAAVAVRADPPFSATSGDTIQVWQNENGEGRRIGTAELRASVGGVATVATDDGVAQQLDPTVDYRLMTLSANTHPDREFAAMLRRGDETMSIVEIGPESQYVGVSIGTLDVTIIAVRSPDGDVDTIPKRDRSIQAGDHLFAIGRPETLRRLDSSNETQFIEDEDHHDVISEIDWEIGEGHEQMRGGGHDQEIGEGNNRETGDGHDQEMDNKNNQRIARRGRNQADRENTDSADGSGVE